MNVLLKMSCCAVVLALLVPSTAMASEETIGPVGINSAGLTLPNGTPLTGAGIGIGQVEPKRSGDSKNPDGTPFDTLGIYFNPSVNPEEVFFARFSVPNDPSSAVTFNATPNEPTYIIPDDLLEGTHATEVAGVMISTDTQPAGTPKATGVSTGAKLYSIGYNAANGGLQESASVMTQYLTEQNNGDLRAINMSFAIEIRAPNVLDGNSPFTQFVDWSARKNNILYVSAGSQFDSQMNSDSTSLPTDNFNGITVGRSVKEDVGGGVFRYRRVSPGNDFSKDAVGPRTSIDIIAPGDDILVASTLPNNQTRSGTSYAAPHVTGTVALLQEYGDFQIAAGAQNWGGTVASGPTARRHEVMKAVLMNSADKIEDTSNNGKYLGMERTVLKTTSTGGVPDDWFDSEAYLEVETAFFDTPLDEQMGAGHLNAKRALQQFLPGEQEVNGNFNTPIVGDVPLIGWDYGTIAGPNFPINKYLLDTPLEAGNFISITLAWDREVEFANDADMDGEFDVGDTFEEYTDLDDVLTNLDLYLVPKDTFDVGEFDIAISESLVSPVEHIFTEIPFDGEYEIWVYRNEQFAPAQDYAIAWWYGLAPEIQAPELLGDFDSDNDADGADFLAWQRDTALGSLSDWENDFGMTGGALAASSAVPEPATGLLLMMGLIFATQAGPRSRQAIGCRK